MDTRRATKATAHQFVRIIYAMVTNQREYEGINVKQFEAQRADKKIQRLEKQARKLGLALVKSEDESNSSSNQKVA